jgi:hypothetical protein
MSLKDPVSSLVSGQAVLLFSNIDETFNSLLARDFRKAACGHPYWKHFYHMLHSLDQWFINPFEFIEPGMQVSGLNSYDVKIKKQLGKKELLKYYGQIRSKIKKYLASLKDAELAEKPAGCRYTRLDLIIAQSRHLMYHIGFIHACIRNDTGKWPEYKGLSNPLQRI